jgi:GT2 family glycosyltransferase
MVYALIPAHNNKDEVLELLGCLARQTYDDLRIVLVDDGSIDGTGQAVRVRFPRVTILQGDGHLWWTGANVVGVDYVFGLGKEEDFVLLLNNDVIVDDEYVRRLVECSEKSGRALVGSTVVDYHDRRQISGGIRLDRKLNPTVNRAPHVIAATESDACVDVLPGRGTLIPLEVFHAVGTFNQQRLPHYGADYEFTIRAKRAGFKLMVSHRAMLLAKMNITGIHLTERPRLSLSECAQLLFSRKSSANVYYYLTYVWICSEEGWKLRNTVSHGIGLFMDTFGRTIVGCPFAIIFRLWVKGTRIMRAS